MADPTALKKTKARLQRSAPPADEISENIFPPRPASPPLTEPYHRIDGRSLRRTGRTVQFATRVSPAFDMQLRAIAQRERISLAEVMERALAFYEQHHQRTAK